MTIEAPHSDRHKWLVLSNTTLGVFMAMLNQSIVIISLPAIFRGIRLDPLQPFNIGYLLWLLQGYMVVTAVMVVTFGRIGDMFGRVRMYNAGFAIFTVASLGLAAMPSSGSTGAAALIVLRIVEGIGGALLMANSTAILTDAFSTEQRGMALGFNIVAAVSASFIGLTSRLPVAMAHGLVLQGVPTATAAKVAALPAVATLFAALLGLNPIKQLLGTHVLHQIGPTHAATVTGTSFFPSLISGPFHHGLVIAFGASALLCAAAAAFSWWAGDCRDDPVDANAAVRQRHDLRRRDRGSATRRGRSVRRR
jgi:MFS family permease